VSAWERAEAIVAAQGSETAGLARFTPTNDGNALQPSSCNAATRCVS